MPEMQNKTKAKLKIPSLPPHNLDAEKSVLGCGLSSEKSLVELVSLLQASDFYDPRHRIIYASMLSLMAEAKPVDLLTVFSLLDSQQLAEKVGGMPYLSDLVNQPHILRNTAEYAAIVKEKAVLRRTIEELTEVVQDCLAESATSDEILNLAATKIFSIREDRSQDGMEPIQNLLSRQIEDYLNPKPHEKPLASGFGRMDRALNGLRKGTLTILAARPAMGKSALALNIATLSAIEQNATVAIFSLEMSKEEIASRILSSYAQVDSRLLQRREVASKDWDRITAAFSRFASSNLYINDRAGLTATELMAQCRRLKMEKNLNLIVIDYLQLMSGGNNRRGDNRQQEISEISRSLKLMAKELEVPVIALSQLSRACEQRENKRPLLSDLRESGSLEQDADVVLFLYRDQYYKKEEIMADVEEAELIIAKNRAGETGTVKLGWIPRFVRFFDPDTEMMEAPPHSSYQPELIPPPSEAPVDYV